MATIKKLKPEYFAEVKRSIRWNWNMKKVALKHGISLKTVLQVRGSRNYAEYQAQNKAQHPEVKFSLKDEVLALHKTVFDKGDNKYHEPLTARTAITQLNYELAKRNK